jgi:hypothetical protein
MAVPEEVGLLSGLETLCLTNANQINALPESIGELSRLRRLEMLCTSVCDVPDSLRKLQHLEFISGMLGGTPITPVGFSRARKAEIARWFPAATIQIG